MPPKRKLTQSDDGESNTKITTTTTTTTVGNKFFGDIIFSFSGTFSVTQGELIKIVEGHGATVAKSVTLKTTHLVSTAEDFKKEGAAVTKAIKQGIFIVSEQFIHKCVEQLKKLDEKEFILSSSADDDEEEEEEEEEEKVVVALPAKRGSKKAAAATKRAKEPETKDDDEEEDTNKLTTRSTKKSKNTESEKSEKSNTTEEFSSDLDDDSDDEKVTVKVSGRAAVDPHFPDRNFHVYDDGKDVYDATLNQTEIAQNNNKFYIIQILESDDGQTLSLWNRWGREGLKGQSKRTDYSKSKLNIAISNFCGKFYEKTHNSWSTRKNFVKVSGKYDLIELDYSTDDNGADVKANKPKAATHESKCSLDERVQDLIKLIFDVKMMKRTMAEAKINLKKCPLGKLSKAQITKGYLVLKEIEEVLLGKSRESLVALSSKFYTAIPHVSDNVMQPPPTINTHQMLVAKMTMLQNLADIEIATTLIKEAESDSSNILESHYKNLKTEIVPLDRSSTEFKDIETYVVNTYKGKTPKIINVFKIDREGEADRFKKTMNLGNRKLLWHGSRLTNFVGIISQGLRIAPPEAPVSGYRFGKGIYFADIMSLSANYCRTSGSDDFCMLLGDVALGKTADLYRDQYMEKPLPNTHSTLALGSIEPDPKQVHSHNDGYVIPYGKIVDSPYKGKSVSCLEHQYIVYNVDQVQLKYLLQLKYN